MHHPQASGLIGSPMSRSVQHFPFFQAGGTIRLPWILLILVSAGCSQIVACHNHSDLQRPWMRAGGGAGVALELNCYSSYLRHWAARHNWGATWARSCRGGVQVVWPATGRWAAGQVARLYTSMSRTLHGALPTSCHVLQLHHVWPHNSHTTMCRATSISIREWEQRVDVQGCRYPCPARGLHEFCAVARTCCMHRAHTKHRLNGTVITLILRRIIRLNVLALNY
jgi:hypothetical protein